MGKSLLITISALLPLLSCTKTESRKEKGSIEGIITIFNTGHTVDAFVELMDCQTCPYRYRHPIGNDGYYKIDNITEGTYFLKVLKKNYIDTICNRYIIVESGKTSSISWYIEPQVPKLNIIANGADIDTLDFGSSLNTRMFQIINDGENTIDWNIDMDVIKKYYTWIEDIQPHEGKLTVTDKVQSIIVSINRNELTEDTNLANIIITAGKNSGKELFVKAAGTVIPKLVTKDIEQSEISWSSVVLHGSMTHAGSPPYTKRGFEISTTSDFTHIVSSVEEIPLTPHAEFTATISHLNFGTRYYARAYAINKVGTAYGSETQTKSFVTKAASPQVITNNMTGIIANGNITEVGEPPYYKRGFCFATSTMNPTIDDMKVENFDTTAGPYNMLLSGLVADEHYYVRAYAVSAYATVYGAPMSLHTYLSTFETWDVLPSEIGTTFAIIEGLMYDEGNPVYTERGICYSITNKAPTISDKRIVDTNVGRGYYQITITGLKPQTRYYAKVYTKSSLGVKYGDTISFITKS